MNAPKVPVLDFRDYVADDASRRAAFVAALGGALESLGFVAITHHGVDRALLDGAYDAAERLFALPIAAKQACEDAEGGRQRGYTPFGLEHARDVEVADLKEFWQVGRRLPADHPLSVSGVMRPNLFPAGTELGASFEALYVAVEHFAHQLLDAVGAYLGHPASTFRELTRDGDSAMRVIHYPPLPEHTPPGAVRAARHEDINLMTVLPSSTRPGLELLTHDGQWMPVHTPPDVMICDTGDMMKRITGGRLKATTHRVVTPVGAERAPRYSLPFFVHPRADALLAPLEGDAEPIRARAFLVARLREIGVL